MKRTTSITLLLALFALGLAPLLTSCCCCGTRAGSQRQIALFDGSSLSGWEAVLQDPNVPANDVWTVKDGILTCKGEPLGYLYKGPNVTNFRLQVEYRWPPGTQPGNSGIFSRITPNTGALPKAVEVQLKHGNAGDVLGLRGRTVASGQPRFFEVKAHPIAGDIAGVKQLCDLEHSAGEWNSVEILAQGPRYTVWVNSQLVNQVEGVEVLSGPVAIQSEGGLIEFRRIVLQPLK